MDQPQKVVIEMKDLKGIITEAIKGMDIPQIAALKAEIEQVNKRAIFPQSEGDLLESSTKSIIDTSFFNKSYEQRPFGGARVDGDLMGARLKSAGGPFLKLSPAMERFADIIRCRGRIEKLMEKGININEYNKALIEAEKKSTVGLATMDVGALVPVEYLATVIEFATAQSQILPLVWRIPMTTMTMRIPKLVQAAGSYFGGVVLYHPEEAHIKYPTKPEFDNDLVFTAKKLIGLIAITDELIADSSLNIINYVTGLFVRAFQYQIEYEILRGTGTLGAMLGILADPAINFVPRHKVGTVQYEDLIDLESSLDENFTKLNFVSTRATTNTLRKQKDTIGQPVYHDGFTTFLGGAMVPQLLGYPIIKTRNCPALGQQGDLILGDFSFYIWALRQDMTIDTSRDALFFFDETCVRFVMREDGMPGVSIAFSVLDAHLS
jgi:HK97 family phage major capsid protein